MHLSPGKHTPVLQKPNTASEAHHPTNKEKNKKKKKRTGERNAPLISSSPPSGTEASTSCPASHRPHSAALSLRAQCVRACHPTSPTAPPHAITATPPTLQLHPRSRSLPLPSLAAASPGLGPVFAPAPAAPAPAPATSFPPPPP
eukprot:1425304-Rhodomonas_salina.1